MSDEDDIRIGRIVAFVEREINDEIEAIAQFVENRMNHVWVYDPGGFPSRLMKVTKEKETLENIAAAIRARKRSTDR